MAKLKKRKSKKEKAGDMLVSYLKLKTAGKAAKGVKKGAKKAAKGTAVVSKKTPVAKRVPLFVGAAVAALFAAKKIHGHRGDPAAA
jgi:hypothetical protein